MYCQPCSLFDPLDDSAAQTGAEGQNSTLMDATMANKLTDCADSLKVSRLVHLPVTSMCRLLLILRL